MVVPNLTLTASDELRPRAERVAAKVRDRLNPLLPGAEIDHIGATAVPGAITKGDLDLVVRVTRTGFSGAKDILGAHFEIKQPDNWTPDFASFGDDTGYDLPLGIQLVVKAADLDFLTFLRDYLIQHPAALAEYNRLKMQNADLGPEVYWQAKNAFFTKILASRKR